MAASHLNSNSTKNFCLYKKEPSNLEDRKEGEDADVVVSVVATDLDADKESHLRRYVVQKATKNLLYKSGTINVIPRGGGSTSPVLRRESTSTSSQLVSFIALVEFAGEHLDVPQEVVQDDTSDETPVLPKPVSREYFICFLCEVDNDVHSLGLYPETTSHYTSPRRTHTLSSTHYFIMISIISILHHHIFHASHHPIYRTLY